LEYFQGALTRDPRYALAYTGVADVYGQLGMYDALGPEESFGRAAEAARQALAIDPGLAEGHMSLGWAKTYYEWDWAGAEAAYRRAVALKPSSVHALNWFGCHLTTVGRLEEARELLDRARQLDPLSPVIGYTQGIVTYFSRDYDQAIRQFREVLEVHPDFVRAHMWLGQALSFAGQPDESIRQTHRAWELGGERDVASLEFLGLVHALAGQKPEGEAILQRLQQLAHERYVSPYLVARIHLALGREGEAFTWMERAFRVRDHWLPAAMIIEPGLDELRGVGRLAELTRRIGLSAEADTGLRRSLPRSSDRR